MEKGKTDGPALIRWFLGYTLNEELPHFSTVSYNFRHRFTEETIEAVFQRVPNEAGTVGALSPLSRSYFFISDLIFWAV